MRPQEEESAILSAWARGACAGDEELQDVLNACALRFLRRHGCSLVEEPAPGWRGLLRVGRTAAAVSDSGVVRSSELFHVQDLESFEQDVEERAWVIGAASWDDKAALFTRSPPPRRTRDEAPMLDWSGEALLRAAPDQVRQMEYLLNAALERHPRAHALLEPNPPGVPPGHRRLLPPVRHGLEEALRAVQGPAAARCLDGFRSLLDPVRMRVLSCAAANSVRAHNWLCGLDRTGCDEAVSLYRMQAASAWPMAWALLAAPSGRVSDAVRTGVPLIPVLATALGVSEGVVRRMNGLTAAAAGMDAPDEGAAIRAASSVSCMPPGAPPRTEVEWHAFFAAARLARAAGAALEDEEAGAGLLASSAGRWHELDAEGVRQAAGGLGDMLADIHANLMQPAARLMGDARWNAVRTARTVFGGRTLPQLAQASSWWHAGQANVRAQLSARYPKAAGRIGLPHAWPTLHTAGGTWTAPNGLQIVPLCSAPELLDEHERMGHCIDTYADVCLLSGSHIVSVRRMGMHKSLGTAEIVQESLLPKVATLSEPPDAPLRQLPDGVKQFKAHHNSEPVIEAWEALWSYVGAILTGVLDVDAAALQEALEGRRDAAGSRSTDSRTVRSCYAATTHEAVAQAWRLYGPALPRAMAKKGPASVWPRLGPDAACAVVPERR
jgi:hypothetical protein